MKKPGFTIIELLVVIAIIAILAAILFPVFAQAREKARAATCVSNLKQLSLGILQYTQDSDETFPLAWDNSTNVWENAVYPYVKSQDVYNCPDESFPANDPDATWTTNPGFVGAYTYPSYDYDGSLGSFNINAAYWDGAYASGLGPSYAGLDPSYNGVTANGITYSSADQSTIVSSTLSQLVSPATEVLLTEMAPGAFPGYGFTFLPYGDANGSGGGGDLAYAAPNQNIFVSGESGGNLCFGAYPDLCAIARHQGLTNILWADGHVKATQLSYVTKYNSKGIMYHFTDQDNEN